jgi:hypothetical protein
LFGADPLLALDCSDPVTMLALQGALDHAAELHAEWRQDLAVRLNNVIAKAVG